MSWDYKISEKALNQLRKSGAEPARRIVAFLDDRIAGTNDPRDTGKRLKGELGEFWRYRVDDYRLICKIEDANLIVLVVRIGYRRDVCD
ncbi:MAG: type II toxin-antitoxin system RelE family toxin [Luteolibacter sp.]